MKFRYRDEDYISSIVYEGAEHVSNLFNPPVYIDQAIPLAKFRFIKGMLNYEKQAVMEEIQKTIDRLKNRHLAAWRNRGTFFDFVAPPSPMVGIRKMLEEYFEIAIWL